MNHFAPAWKSLLGYLHPSSCPPEAFPLSIRPSVPDTAITSIHFGNFIKIGNQLIGIISLALTNLIYMFLVIRKL